ncbi:cytochrome c oxidase assembly protein, partial [Marinobacter alexandrii]|uniref:cytochrome c oxidase assembly protein n=1 Tax=Marinobacter alexandrii TaxID=2570351 RepID=UPI00329A3437
MDERTPEAEARPRTNARVVSWCLAGVVGMFAFGFALVPLYDVFCEITGINGKTGGRYEAVAAAEADVTRTVQVQFLAQNGPGMPWAFRPVTR